ncbi:MAG: hypothetical protein IT379_25965 [Deltaproteobacteria bacterium]|nr:hypothetical protein [Deltaproteobacteria bacterium]
MLALSLLGGLGCGLEKTGYSDPCPEGEDCDPSGDRDGATPPSDDDDAGSAPRRDAGPTPPTPPRDAGPSSGPDSATPPPPPAPPVPPPPPPPAPGDGLRFVRYDATRADEDPSWGSVLTDIAQHLPPDYGWMYWDSDLITAAHETTHGINSDIRNYHNDTGRRANGFYVLENRAVLIVEPAIRKSDANRFVPAALRGSRYDLYLEGSPDWDDTPTYLFDEWVAYTNGGAVGVDLVRSGLWTYGWRDGVAGQLEFTVYALAVAMAVEEGDATYWASPDGAQFREFVAWNARRAMTLYREGATFPDFAWDEQDSYYARMRTGEDAAAMRSFVERVWGAALAREIFGE